MPRETVKLPTLEEIRQALQTHYDLMYSDYKDARSKGLSSREKLAFQVDCLLSAQIEVCKVQEA